MPLQKKASRKAFDENFSELMHAGKPKEQALAISFETAREAGADWAKKKRKKRAAKTVKCKGRKGGKR